MIYHNRDEVERIGPAGSFIDSTGEQPCYRFLSSFWLYCEQEDLAFTPHANSGFWEAWITVWMSQQFDSHEFFVDAGANVGYYTMLAANHGLHSIAFEPQPKLFDLMRQSVEKNNFKNTELHLKALGSEQGTSKFHVPEFHSGGASLFENEEDTVTKYTTISVDVVTLDEAIKLPPKARILMKIDAEGAEPVILDGMKETWKNNSMTVCLEWESSRFKKPLEFAERLAAMSTTLSVVNENGTENTMTPQQLTESPSLEMVVIRNEAV